MSDNASLERLNAQAAFIQDAVLGESARWGGRRTVNGDWIPNVQLHRERIRGNAVEFDNARLVYETGGKALALD